MTGPQLSGMGWEEDETDNGSPLRRPWQAILDPGTFR
jgi:hypothetical protein